MDNLRSRLSDRERYTHEPITPRNLQSLAHSNRWSGLLHLRPFLYRQRLFLSVSRLVFSMRDFVPLFDLAVRRHKVEKSKSCNG